VELLRLALESIRVSIKAVTENTEDIWTSGGGVKLDGLYLLVFYIYIYILFIYLSLFYLSVFSFFSL
jgi:hypothetical protein